MCTKPNNTRLQDIKRRAFTDRRLKSNFEKYELVRQLGYFNMFDPKAIELTGLTKDEYFYILQNYSTLMTKYPYIKNKVRKQIRLYNYINYIKNKSKSKNLNKKSKLDITEPKLNCYQVHVK